MDSFSSGFLGPPAKHTATKKLNITPDGDARPTSKSLSEIQIKCQQENGQYWIRYCNKSRWTMHIKQLLNLYQSRFALQCDRLDFQHRQAQFTEKFNWM
jgi:hypothetical protein